MSELELPADYHFYAASEHHACSIYLMTAEDGSLWLTVAIRTCGGIPDAIGVAKVLDREFNITGDSNIPFSLSNFNKLILKAKEVMKVCEERYGIKFLIGRDGWKELWKVPKSQLDGEWKTLMDHNPDMTVPGLAFIWDGRYAVSEAEMNNPTTKATMEYVSRLDYAARKVKEHNNTL